MSENKKTVQDLLTQRETRGLRVPVMFRIVFALFGLYSVLAGRQATEVNLLAPIITYIVFIGTNIYFLILLYHSKKLKFVGWAGLFLDTFAITSYLLINIVLFREAGLSPAIIGRDLFIVVCLTFIAINSLAMRPLYPAVLTLTAIALHVHLWIVAIKDPSTVWAEFDFATASVSHRLFYSEIIFLIIIGGALTLLAWSARRTVIQAVALEVERSQTLQRQTQLVMDAKISALANLVAGISHDMNTPLGVVKNNADSLGRGLDRIKQGIDHVIDTGEADAKLDRILQVVRESSNTSIEAANRLEDTVKRLRTFARLDEAELQLTDVRSDLNDVLKLLPPEMMDQVRIRKEFDDVPKLRCYPYRLNQVFMTLITRAFDSVESNGIVTIRIKEIDENIVIAIADNGRGMSESEAENLFDVQISSEDNRMTTGFNMAAAQTIVVQHGGTLVADSRPEQGTTMTIRLPLKNPAGKRT